MMNGMPELSRAVRSLRLVASACLPALVTSCASLAGLSGGEGDAATDSAHPRDASDSGHPADAKRDTGAKDARGDGAGLVDSGGGETGRWPSAAGSTTTTTASTNFALHYIWLGDTKTTSAFTADPLAWQTFGYNIDGKLTTSTSTDVCTLATGASSTVQVDGNNGRDDSFGENLIPLLSGFYLAYSGKGASDYLSNLFVKGEETVLFDVTGLAPDPHQTNTGLSAEVFSGAAFSDAATSDAAFSDAMKPTFTMADNWPVDPTSLANGVSLSGGARSFFASSYITNGTWVSGDPTSLVITIHFGTIPLTLRLFQAVVTFQHSIDDGGAQHASSGVISGILKPGDLVSGLAGVLGQTFTGNYCTILASVSEKIYGAVDILEDGTNTPGQACDGISIAFGFQGDAIQLPSKVGLAPATIDGGLASCALDAATGG